MVVGILTARNDPPAGLATDESLAGGKLSLLHSFNPGPLVKQAGVPTTRPTDTCVFVTAQACSGRGSLFLCLAIYPMKLILHAPPIGQGARNKVQVVPS